MFFNRGHDEPKMYLNCVAFKILLTIKCCKQFHEQLAKH